MGSTADDAFHADEHCHGAWIRCQGSVVATVSLRRSVASWWDATPDERDAVLRAVEMARWTLLHRHGAAAVDIGWRDQVGSAAGVPLTVRVAPVVASPAPTMPHPRGLVRGEDDPLIDHLAACFPHAERVDIAVAFVLDRGVERSRPFLEDLLAREGQLRLITGDYFGVTEPNGLERLLDLDGAIELRVFESRGQSFHPKAYVFHLRGAQGIAFVGSSNLSATALGNGVEWNYRVVRSQDHDGFAAVCDGFERVLRHAKSRVLTHDWVASYRRDRRPDAGARAGIASEVGPSPQPHAVQVSALGALQSTRAAGNRAGLVVLATGLGKTWLSAFDSQGFERVLFVAHRDEILDQALGTFRRIRPEARLGKFTGQDEAPDADVLFASIQTLGRMRHLRDFAPDRFDYIVVDEFHHAAARTYRNLIEHFAPRFMLGLTATPERTDGADLLAMCGHNLVFRCDLGDGVRSGQLCPFRYVGVPDDVDYAQIPWRSTRFDETALTEALATQHRAQNAFEQHQKWAGARTLGFCASQRHADFMAEFFRARGKRAVAVHSGPTSAPRANALEDLKHGALDLVFSVDMFNEGVDVPEVDTVMMLRPTESRIVWLQQFGRGLRVADGKGFLRVIDYIGNHRSFLDKPRVLLSALMDIGEGHAALRRALDALRSGDVELPAGCEIAYELTAVEILERLLRPSTGEDDLRAAYEEFRLRHGRRPTAAELHGSGCLKKGVLRKAARSWFGFVDAMGDLDDHERRLLASHEPFLAELEASLMERSYKMVVLQAMLELGALPGTVGIRQLTERFERVAERSPAIRDEVMATLAGRRESLEAMLRSNPLRAWAGTKRGAGSEFFALGDDNFRTRFAVDDADREIFVELVRELVEWRLVEHLERPDLRVFRCRVTYDALRPVLVLPDRRRSPWLPSGPTTVLVGDETFTANFAKAAVNVVHAADDPGTNHLPRILRGWFGDHPGAAGHPDSVVMEQVADGYRMKPEREASVARHRDATLTVGHSYMREEIPAFFGRTFNTSHWRQGFLSLPGHLILLVTLEKAGRPAEHQYADHFEAPHLFHWQSQNKTRQGDKHGRQIHDHERLGLRVHLFVRRNGKRAQKAAPFVYCGELRFLDWQGESPISVRWELKSPLTGALWQQLEPRS